MTETVSTWYLGSQNDGLFIIDKPPRPSNDDQWHDRPDGPSLVIPLGSTAKDKAQAIVDAHNAALRAATPPAPERLSHETSIETIDVRAGTSAFVRNQERKEVGVKPLEWRQEPIPPMGEWLASSPVGLYCILISSDKFRLRFRDQATIGTFDTLEEAKAAAQADYDAAIRSTLTPAFGGEVMDAARAGWERGRNSWCPAGVLADEARTEREWAEALPRILATLKAGE
jgi:hypothetical protein